MVPATAPNSHHGAITAKLTTPEICLAQATRTAADTHPEEWADAATNLAAPESNLPNFPSTRTSRKFTADHHASRSWLRVGKRLPGGNQLAATLLLQLLDPFRGVVEEPTLGLDAQLPGGNLVGHRLAHVR